MAGRSASSLRISDSPLRDARPIPWRPDVQCEARDASVLGIATDQCTLFAIPVFGATALNLNVLAACRRRCSEFQLFEIPATGEGSPTAAEEERRLCHRASAFASSSSFATESASPKEAPRLLFAAFLPWIAANVLGSNGRAFAIVVQ